MLNIEQYLISDECLMLIHEQVFWKFRAFVLGKEYTELSEIC